MSPRVEICFVSGFERNWRPPNGLQVAGLNRRIAVVQDSYVPGEIDMFFDQPLLLAMIDFLREVAPGGDITAVNDLRRDGQPVEIWLAGWNALAAEDRQAPAAIRVSVEGRTTVCIVTEFWNRVGGPRPYHDSWTYSVLSERDLSSDLPAFLAKRPEASRWTVVPAVLDAPVFPEPSAPGPFDWLARLFS